jgi:hypothetical protein
MGIVNGIGRARDEVSLARREIREGRFQRSMAVITSFAAIVSGFEAYTQHRRGAFAYKLMWTPAWLTPPVVVSAAAALFSESAAHRLLPISAIASLLDGLVGFVFHLRGIGRRPGGYGLGRYNIMMGPPVFAPLLMGITGLLGLLASLLRPETTNALVVEADDVWPAIAPGAAARSGLRTLEFAVSHGRFQKLMAAAAATLAALAGGEAYFEHLRGSYNSFAMLTPVVLTPPVMAAAAASVRSERVARHLLPWASIVIFVDGLAGFYLHVRGLIRMPGDLRNLSFNVTYGPPLFAPLLFCATGLLGMIASLLGRRESR